VKYTDRDSHIWVTVCRDSDRGVVSVRDNGPGIPAEMLSRIFDLFTQVDQTLGRSNGGLGIGLTLSKSLVELHGGTIVARSDGPGAGSEFLVELPLLTESGAWNEVPRRLRRPSTARMHRVLVVDDVAASAKTLAMLLDAMGQKVDVRYDGQSALQAAAELRPDLVFLDIAMPGMDGYEVARRMRADRALDGVSLVALTGYGQQEDRKRAFDAGFDHHLVKPISAEILEEVLTRVGG
jgi:CheY-like chemotaxis protein